MKKETLLKKLKLLGYSLFETEESLDANEVLAEVVKSEDTRLWEGFPLLLANACKKGLFQNNAVEMQFKDLNNRRYYRNLVTMSYALFVFLGLKFTWMDELRRLTFFNEKLFGGFLKSFKNKGDLTGEVKNLSGAKVVKTFKNYFKETAADLEKYTQMREELELEYALSQLFSKKQKELFMKRLKREKMTKTQQEYITR